MKLNILTPYVSSAGLVCTHPCHRSMGGPCLLLLLCLVTCRLTAALGNDGVPQDMALFWGSRMCGLFHLPLGCAGP